MMQACWGHCCLSKDLLKAVPLITEVWIRPWTWTKQCKNAREKMAFATFFPQAVLPAPCSDVNHLSESDPSKPAMLCMVLNQATIQGAP